MTIRAEKLDELLAKHNMSCDNGVCKTLDIMPKKKRIKKTDKWVVKVMGKQVGDMFDDREQAYGWAMKHRLELCEVVRIEV